LTEASKTAYEKQLEVSTGKARPITTEITPASDYEQYGGLWYFAEAYHQQYLSKPGSRPYCSAQPQGASLPDYDKWCPFEKDSDLKKKHQPTLPAAFWSKYAEGAQGGGYQQQQDGGYGQQAPQYGGHQQQVSNGRAVVPCVACIYNFLDSLPRRRKPVKLRSCCMRTINASTTYYPAIYEAGYSDVHSSSLWDRLSSFSKWVLYIIGGFTLLLLVWSVLPISEHHKFGPKNFLVFCATFAQAIILLKIVCSRHSNDVSVIPSPVQDSEPSYSGKLELPGFYFEADAIVTRFNSIIILRNRIA
jgi:hypothetical protein